MANEQHLKVLDSWMATVAPANYSGEAGIHTPLALESLAAFNTASGAMETPANMQVTGQKNKVAELQAALFETQQSNGVTSPESVKKLLEAPASGLMHVSDLARIANNWNPVLLDKSEANSDAYKAYIAQLVKFPLVTLNYAQHQTIERKTSDWNTIINAISDTFTGIVGEDKKAIVGGLKALAQAASSKMRTKQKTSLFCQNALNVANDKYEFFLYYSTVTFYEEKAKGFHTMQNTFDVTQIKVTLLMELWTEAAVQKIIGKTDSSLDDWLNKNSTSTEGTKPIPALSG